ncbi:MAG: maleylacetoacetate isomerase [Rhizobiales bacterium]|nr:maleylacetoacetate isomerase [Hyphomicrobiales bacterium]
MRLYTFYRSLAAWRVRVALSLKGETPDLVTIDLLAGDQHQADFKSRNPESSVPLLEIDDLSLAQSLAILEYLEETRPEPALLPATPAERALVRRFALISAADSHPLIVPRARSFLKDSLGHDDDDVALWCRNWLMRGCEAMENLLADQTVHKFSFADRPLISDLCLVPHLFGTRNFGGDTSSFTRLTAIEEECNELDAFANNHPRLQPDFPG